ncbi:DUF4261 domain-containing protein [Rubritalea marina]|uniref:DUF4261 domain-containing protein n=1 Tax=Rubritalea marina TaxID=361055 RepID=UPI00037C209B|nr:DUF4261 domain-containing protein [Rubritalea marina]
MQKHSTIAITLGLFLSPAAIAQTPKTDADQQIPVAELVPLRPANEAQFAFLCLENNQLASEETIKEELTRWFKLNTDQQIHEFSIDAVAKVVQWRIGRSRFVAVLEDAPIPSGDTHYAAENSLHWPDAKTEVDKHKANITITCTSIRRPAWHAAADLTHALAAFTDAHPTIAVYWGDASILHEPSSFLKQAEWRIGSPAPAPSNLWVGLLFEAHAKGGWNIFTDGMHPLGLRDIEIENSQLDRPRLFDMLTMLRKQAIAGTLKIEDGTEVQDSHGATWQFQSAKSLIEKAEPVWRLSLIEKK